MSEDQAVEIVKAAGVICKAPSGRVLLMHRTDGEGWAWPGGVLKDGETPEQGAWREVFEETGRRLGDVGGQLMRRVKDGVDFVTFICPVDDEFVPRMNHEHDSWMWADPEAALEQAKAASEPMAIADSAEPVHNEGPAALKQALDEGFNEELDAPVSGEGEIEINPDQPVADESKGSNPMDEDDIPDDVLDLCLSVITDLEARLAKLEGDEPVSPDDNEPELETADCDWDDGEVVNDRKAAQRLGTRFRSV